MHVLLRSQFDALTSTARGAMLLLLASCAAACGRGGADPQPAPGDPPAASDPATTDAPTARMGTEVAARAPVPPSRHLVGRFEYTAELHGEVVRLGWSFDDEEAARWTHDVVTARHPYRVTDESEHTVTLELLVAAASEDGEPTVESTQVFRFLDDDTLVHAAAPEVQYRRLPPEPRPTDGAEPPPSVGTAP